MTRPFPILPGGGYTPLLRPAQVLGCRKKKKRARRPFAAPARSSRLYVYLPPDLVHLFRFYLETEDNLGLMTVVDRWRAALLLRFSPHQERRMREFLESVGQALPLQIVEPSS